MLRWNAAFHCFAIAADAAGVSHTVPKRRQHYLFGSPCSGLDLSRSARPLASLLQHCGYTIAQRWAHRHTHVGVWFAVNATSETPSRRQTFGQIYDEIARREWSECARRGTQALLSHR